MLLIFALSFFKILKENMSKIYTLYKSYSICIMKISAKNLVYVIFAFVWLFMGYPISSIIAVGALGYFNPLYKLGENRI